jgi:3-methylcrotonyl-CoA carboxylase beta subunit
MSAIKTRIDPHSTEFLRNAEHMRALVDHLKAQIVRAAEGGSLSACEKHPARGKRMVRERFRLLLDADSPFLEFSPLAVHGYALLSVTPSL